MAAQAVRDGCHPATCRATKNVVSAGPTHRTSCEAATNSAVGAPSTVAGMLGRLVDCGLRGRYKINGGRGLQLLGSPKDENYATGGQDGSNIAQ